MPLWCLPKNKANDFYNRLIKKEIDPQKLIEMGSKERRKYFASFLGGKDGAHVNALFESKLLLKNQQRGMITWAKQMAGLKPQAKTDLLNRVNKMKEVLTPENQDVYLEDLVNYKLKANVSFEEAKKISELAQDAQSKQHLIGTDRRLEYGAAKVAFEEYVQELKHATAWEKFKSDIKDPRKAAIELAGVAKSAKATLDNSALLRQGWKTLFTNPKIWAKNALKSFDDIVKTLGNKKVMGSVMADILSRKNIDNYIKDRLDIGVTEEAYPASAALERIPFFGRLHKASEVAFTAFQRRNRADLYDYYTDVATKSGLTETTGIGLGKLVNSLTGRGSLGKYETSAKLLNNVFFSPKLLKSHIDVLTAHAFDKSISPFVKKQAALNLLKIISGTSAVLATAHALKPGSVDIDPRSANFGKIKIGNTRFDVSGGMSSVVTLASRLIPTVNNGKWGLYTKSSTTNQVYPLNSGKFGAPKGTDVVYNFFENKLAPAVSVTKDLLKGQDFQGRKPTLGGELENLLEPLPITTYKELQNDPNSANVLIGLIADALGISVNTYSKQTKSGRARRTGRTTTRKQR